MSENALRSSIDGMTILNLGSRKVFSTDGNKLNQNEALRGITSIDSKELRGIIKNIR